MQSRAGRRVGGVLARQRGIGAIGLVLLLLGGVLVVALIWGLRSAHIYASVGSANKAKLTCSAVFVSGRQPAEVLAAEMGVGALEQISTAVDTGSMRTTASMFWTRADAIYRPGIGCTRLVDISVDELRAQIDPERLPSAPDYSGVAWPTGDVLSAGERPEFDAAALDALLDEAFASDVQAAAGTRAIGIVWRGQLIAERYAPGINRDMPLTGWSMTKSLTNALIGLRVGDGELALSEPAPVAAWQGSDDPRRQITLDQLLRASSGLAFEEVYGSVRADAVQMLFGPHGYDMGAYAADKPLAGPPDSIWNYSSGTTNLLQRILRDSFDDLESYHAFVRERLFHAIGMTRTTIAPDASGTLVGSSFGYATARDWLRFGLLFLNDGVWEGQRILPEGWVDYSITPTPADPGGRYGAQWWLNAGPDGDPEARPWPELPRDAYRASGFEGQYLTVIPSHDLVIVRLGYTPDRRRWAMGPFAARVIEIVDGNRS